jgi:D-alanyl-D-alanine carboxypeptidase
MNHFFYPALFFLLGCSTLGSTQPITQQLQQLVDAAYASHPDAVGIMVHVEAPDQGISWSTAVGQSDKKTKAVLHKDQPVLIASNTKTYVAAAILKLIEKKKIQLQQPIEELISKKTKTLLNNDGYQLQLITVKQLLSHTSGIADYVNDDYFSLVNIEPQHQWTRDEQLELAMEVGAPLAEPGKEFKYADINYLLLTEIIEGQTLLPFYRAMRELLEFEKQELHASWFTQLEQAPKNTLPLAHQYWSKYNWDSHLLNPSWDLYGGGGMATTTNDLARFFQALFEGKLIQDDALLDQMHTLVLPAEQSVYCLGLRKISFHGSEAYYHGGFWGTDVMYIPELKVSIALFTLQKEQRALNAKLNQQLILCLKREKEPIPSSSTTDGQ